MEEDGFKLVKSKKSSKKNKKSTNIVLAEKIKEALSLEEISDFVRYLCSLNLPVFYENIRQDVDWVPSRLSQQDQFPLNSRYVAILWGQNGQVHVL